MSAQEMSRIQRNVWMIKGSVFDWGVASLPLLGVPNTSDATAYFLEKPEPGLDRNAGKTGVEAGEL